MDFCMWQKCSIFLNVFGMKIIRRSSTEGEMLWNFGPASIFLQAGLSQYEADDSMHFHLRRRLLAFNREAFGGSPSFPVPRFTHFHVLPSGHPSMAMKAYGLFLFSFGSEAYILFSGGTPLVSQTPSLTVMHGNNMTVLEMEHAVVDFVTLCSTPYNNGKMVESSHVAICPALSVCHLRFLNKLGSHSGSLFGAL